MTSNHFAIIHLLGTSPQVQSSHKRMNFTQDHRYQEAETTRVILQLDRRRQSFDLLNFSRGTLVGIQINIKFSSSCQAIPMAMYPCLSRESPFYACYCSVPNNQCYLSFHKDPSFDNKLNDHPRSQTLTKSRPSPPLILIDLKSTDGSHNR